ncbi:MAG: hypothetical protein C0621_01580 [Desulfuromonas sp.]|nr:MAG: hypothetical protein C0621_01580 [Desulfuromonas sp.]
MVDKNEFSFEENNDEDFSLDGGEFPPGDEEAPAEKPKKKAPSRLMVLLLLVVVLAAAGFYVLVGMPEPEAPAPAPAPAPVQRQAIAVPEKTPVAKPAPEPQAKEEPAPVAEVAPAPAPASEVPPVPAPTAPAAPVKSEPVVATPAPIPAPQAAQVAPSLPAAGAHIINSGAYLIEKNVMVAAKKIRAMGYRTEVKTLTRPAEMTRLKVGEFPPDEAKARLAELKPLAEDAFLLGNVLYAGSFHSLNGARAFADRLYEKGILVDEVTTKVDMPLQFLTVVGFGDAASAQAAAAKIKAAGIEAEVRAAK